MENRITIKMKHIQYIIFALVVIAANISAATSVKVYSRDEGLNETNISKPRIYIQNTGTTTLTDFVFYYKLTSEEGRTPVLEDYYTPESQVSLEKISNDEYRLKYQVTGANFAPGQLLPGSAGNIVGLHYNDWGIWDKVNDYSNNRSSTFIENNRISVYVNGVLIYGEEIVGTSGGVTFEVWSNIYGTLVSSVPVNSPFSSTSTLTSIEEVQNYGDNFGTRFRGYITAPLSGSYDFYIASDDCSELRLSSNDRPENKTAIAYVNGYTDSRTWNKYTSQKSAAITLTAGQRYYIEALHKEGTANNNLAVGWLIPGETEIAVISGAVLSPFVAPNATPSLSAAQFSPTQINLSWNDNCTNEEGYRIERSVSGGSYSQIADLGPNSTSFQSSGLTANTIYSYRVRAYNSQGYSSWSNVFTLTSQESTNGVVVREVWENVSGTDISAIPTSIPPSWTSTLNILQEPSNAGDNRGIRIRGYITAPASGSYIFWISGDDDCDFYLSTNSSPSNKVKICYVDGYTAEFEWNKYPSTQKSTTKILTTGQKYYFEILHKEGTQNDNMAVGWLKPGQSGTVPSEVIPGTVLSKFITPAAPSNITATAVSGSQINLAWLDNSDNEESFIIERSLDGTNYSQIASNSPGVTTASVTGLLPATLYTFRVKAVNGAGSSAWSSAVSTTTQQTTGGAISRQMWINVPVGSGVSAIPVNTTPYSEGSLPLFQEPSNAGDAFGTRVRGYLTAPATGNYSFYISGDNDCELWLSTGEDPSDKIKIAFFNGLTAPEQWDLFTTQRSSPIPLDAGKRYYIEVLHVEGNGNDHMAAGWLTPGETGAPVVIPGSVLSMFNAPVAPSALVATAVASTQIDISWDDNSDNETGFIIERALAGQSFAQVGTVGPGIKSYASTGLTPNTQYQFRTRAINFAGNSAWSNTATAITEESSGPGSSGLIPELLSFAIYSQDLSFIDNQSIFSGGGAVGSNTLVRVGLDAKIDGNIVSGGNVQLMDRVEVQGDITCAGTYSFVESAPPQVSGDVTQGAAVTIVDIPVKSAITYGTTDFQVSPGQSVPIAPGSYKNLTVPTGATVTFAKGTYNFKSLTVDINGTILFDVPMDKTIEINVETTFELKNFATAKFPDKGYAPCVAIYTNAYSVNIGTDVKLNGILTAPNANVLIESRTRIEGALYAKNISTRPAAVFMSSCINPNDDDDGDCILNLTEMMLSDEPDNPIAYSLIAAPHPAMIDNTEDPTVTYDFGCKYSYITCRWELTYPAGTLSNASVAPAFALNNKPPEGIPEFVMTGYKPIGSYVGMVLNSLGNEQSLRVALPLFSGIQPMASYSIAWYNAADSEWVLADASPLTPCAVITDAPVSDVSSMIIVQHESNIVAYLDDGMVYSNVVKATLRFNGIIDATSDDDPGADPDSITIYYLEHTTGNPSGIPDSLKWHINNDGSGYLFVNEQQDFDNKITVTGIRIDSPDFFDTYKYSENFVVEPGQMLTFVMDRTADEMSNADVNGDKISALYAANALSFESMSFSEGVIKGSETAWTYDYYLKDHLGSTRMVLDDNGHVKQALMYQPYGTVSDVAAMGATATDPLREKFTTKELDEEGVLPDDQRMAIGIVITMPDNNYTGTYTTKLSTAAEPIESPLYNEVNGSGEPTLQCFGSSTLTGTKYYEYIEIKIKNTTTGVTTTYHLDGIHWAGQIGHLKRYTLDRTFSEIQAAISTSTNLFVEGNYLLGNSRMNLVYFGARYLDPDLGIWTSRDPEEQFWSSYTYAGNGYNPINGIDPKGNRIDVVKDDAGVVNVTISATVIDLRKNAEPIDVETFSSEITNNLNTIDNTKFCLDLNVGKPRDGDHIIYILKEGDYVNYHMVLPTGRIIHMYTGEDGYGKRFGMDIVVKSEFIRGLPNLIAHEFTHPMGYSGPSTEIKVITAEKILRNKSLMNQKLYNLIPGAKADIIHDPSGLHK
jgi:RHS repeat-associated protein